MDNFFVMGIFSSWREKSCVEMREQLVMFDPQEKTKLDFSFEYYLEVTSVKLTLEHLS